MAKKTKTNQTYAAEVYRTFAVIATVAFVIIGGLAWWAYSFATTMVKTELGAQKIYFPKKGSEGFSAAEYPTLQKYAGQLVDTGPEAKAYANEYIAAHLDNIADGKKYAEVSAAAQKDPANQKLQGQRQALFMGETLRGMLLGNGYAFWSLGQIALYASIACFTLAIVTALIAARFSFLR